MRKLMMVAVAALAVPAAAFADHDSVSYVGTIVRERG